MPSVFKSQPMLFNFGVPFPQNNYHADSAYCVFDFLRLLKNLLVMWGRVVLG